MRHRKDLAKLGRPRAHRKALVRSLVRSLFMYDRIKTTLPKAKAAQRLAERLVSRSRRGDVAARRYVYSHLGDHQLVAHLFDEITPRFADQASGFTRIFMLGTRHGDGAQLAILEMSRKGETKKAKKTKPEAKPSRKKSEKESAKERKSEPEKKKEKKKKSPAKKKSSAKTPKQKSK